jgi:serine/threonine protein kinase
VLALHSVQVQLYPEFLRSQCFKLYANMLHFAFNRPAYSRDSFVWLKVREKRGRVVCGGEGRTIALPSLHSQAPFHSFLRTQPLGRGGYGMVFAAQKADSGKLYAIKCMGE